MANSSRDLAQLLVDLLQGRRRQLAVAESLTGGLAAVRLTQAEGAADVFAGGVVAYQNGAKRRLLDVSPGPVISRRCALEMADGVARRFAADTALSLTGVAGPETQEGQPVGTVWVGWTIDGHRDAAGLHLGDGRPDQLRERAVVAAFELICDALETQQPISVPLAARPEGARTIDGHRAAADDAGGR